MKNQLATVLVLFAMGCGAALVGAEAATAAGKQVENLTLEQALANRQTLKTEILDKADTVLKTAEARYAAGDISLTDVLPVRRDWAAVQLSYLESLREVMQAWAEVRSFQ